MVNQSQFIEKTTTSSSPLISLKEVVSIVRKNVNPTSGKTYTLYSFPAYDNQQIPEIVDGGEIRSCKLDLTPNTVLYNKLNVRLCRVWNIREIATTNNICSTEFIPLKMDESVLLQEYLVYFLTSEAVTKAMVGVSQGTSNSQKRIAPEALLKLEIPLPPTEVQKEFVAVYRKSDKSKFAGFKSQFISQFGFPQDGDVKHPTSSIEALLEETISGEWGADCADASGTRVIRTTNFTNDGVLNLDDVVLRSIDQKKVEKKQLHKGDIILEKSGGTKDNPVGRLVYFAEDGIYLANNFTQVLRPSNSVNSRYLFAALYYPIYR